ncbi:MULTISPECIES: hypothetical protein [Microbacterium]|uniref:hypothetical protein n=1 Tax=Microbacterium TaxID=33882 RepID=UPI0013A530F4|nr:MULTISPECIES: hypothetical protein [Microbacterium]
MGQVKRYDLISANLEHAAQRDARRGAPIGLSVEQVADTGRRQDAREAVPVSAWMPHRVVYDEARLVDAEAIAWTEGAVLIRWTPPNSSQPLTCGYMRPPCDDVDRFLHGRSLGA